MSGTHVEMEEKVILSNAVLIAGSEGIVRFCWNEGVDETLEDAQMSVEALSRYCRSKKRALLVDGKNMHSITREARDFYAKMSTELLTAAAMLVQTSLSRYIGNFYVTVNRPGVPVRLFTNEAEAILWLNKFVLL